MHEDFDSSTAEVARTHLTGTVWFAAAVLAVSIGLAALLGRGWRPGSLPAADQIVWWVGVAVTLISLVALAYAGCPVLGIPIEREDRYKDLAIQWGVILFLTGAVVTSLAVLLAPA